MANESEIAKISRMIDEMLSNGLVEESILINESKQNEILSILENEILPRVQLLETKEKSSYYSANRGFGYVDSDNSNYYGIKNIEQDGILFYQYINKIASIITGIEETSYAIYIQESDGTIHRQTLTDSELSNIISYRGEGSKRGLAFSLTKIQSGILEMQKNVLITNHINNFMNILNNAVGPVKYGYAMETFEYHFQKMDKLTLPPKHGEYYSNYQIEKIKKSYFARAKNKDAWHTGGDIGNIQVKFLSLKDNGIQVGDETFARLNLASEKSLENVVNELIYIFKNNKDYLTRENIKDLVLLFTQISDGVTINETEKFKKDIESRIQTIIKSLT